MAQELETVEARLDIEVFVNCPKCDFLINLLIPEDTNGTYHNDCGYVLAQALSDHAFSTNHEKFEVEEVTCSKCKTEFNVKGMEW
jgi:phage FluMu protein Com